MAHCFSECGKHTGWQNFQQEFQPSMPLQSMKAIQRKLKRSSSKESAAGFLYTSQSTVQWYFYLNLSHFLVSSQEMGQIGTFFHFTIIAHIFDLYAKVLWRMLFSKFVLGHFFKLQLQNMADFQS